MSPFLKRILSDEPLKLVGDTKRVYDWFVDPLNAQNSHVRQHTDLIIMRFADSFGVSEMLRRNPEILDKCIRVYLDAFCADSYGLEAWLDVIEGKNWHLVDLIKSEKGGENG
jgi:hypothetical protein